MKYYATPSRFFRQSTLAHLVTIFWMLFLASDASQAAEAWETELASFADKTASQVKQSGRKKVTVLDFTDLQGGTSELGRFLAEELTVALVERRAGFAVLDRSNLRKILAELKLTADGLVQPENAKKLGEFSSVDAIIIGSIVRLKESVAVTVKIITTDTAEVVGATRISLTASGEIGGLLSQPSADSSVPSGPKAAGPPRTVLGTQRLGALEVTLESMTPTSSSEIILNLKFKNLGKTSLAVGAYAEFNMLDPDQQLRSSLLGTSGEKFEIWGSGLSGIRAIRSRPQNLTEIAPNDVISVSYAFKNRQYRSSVPTSFIFRSELVINSNYSERSYPPDYQPQQDVLPPNCKLVNLAIDVRNPR